MANNKLIVTEESGSVKFPRRYLCKFLSTRYLSAYCGTYGFEDRRRENERYVFLVFQTAHASVAPPPLPVHYARQEQEKQWR